MYARKNLFNCALVFGLAAATSAGLYSMGFFGDQDNTVQIAQLVPEDLDNTLPIREVGGGKSQQNANQPEKVPEVKLLVLESELMHQPDLKTYQRIRLALVNPTAFAISYTGYTPDSYDKRPPRGGIHPLCSREIEKNGSWVEERVAIKCGVGLASLNIKSGQAGSFVVHQYELGSEFRIGVHYSFVDATGTRQISIVWSERLGKSGAN
jgi:hypothetical protein